MSATILAYNSNLIKKTLGKQGSEQCGVYAVAYGWTILEGRCRVSGSPASHQSVADKYNGGVYATCQWGVMGCTSHSASSNQARYTAIYNQINNGKPVVVAVRGSSYNHYVLVIGYRSGVAANKLQPTDFFIIDPADCGIGYYGTTWASKSGFNGSSYGLQYVTFNNGSATRRELEGDLEYDDNGFINDDPDQIAFDMPTRVSKLYRSDNFIYIDQEKYKTTISYKTTNALSKLALKYLSHVGESVLTKTAAADEARTAKNDRTIPDEAFKAGYLNLITTKSVPRVKVKKATSSFLPTAELVESPFVELGIAGYTIGSYMNSLDEFPNHISSINVKKVNGEINSYTINIVHLVRTGEDPNIIDKLISSVRYSPISIRYGDCMSGKVYSDNEAFITNVAMKRDYRNNQINYTIYASSAGHLVSTVKFNFPGTVDRPSNVIRDLLYHNPETSPLLQETFGEMRSAVEVDSKGWIPNNDAIIDIPAKNNMSTTEYINYLVALMSDSAGDFIKNTASEIMDHVEGVATVAGGIIRLGIKAVEFSGIPGLSQAAGLLDKGSTYLITYLSDRFEIHQVKAIEAEDKLTEKVTLYNTVYDVNIGYPDDNFVMDFTVNNNQSWSMLYENGQVSGEYSYAINRDGETEGTQSLGLTGSTEVTNQIENNWWNQMINFPISATLTLRGSLKNINLMDYVHIDVVFYGQKHHTSGTYVVTAQEDELSSAGFRTKLGLLRVSNF